MLVILILLLISLSNGFQDDYRQDFRKSEDGWAISAADTISIEITDTVLQASTTTPQKYWGPFQGETPDDQYFLKRCFQCSEWSYLTFVMQVITCGVNGDTDQVLLFKNNIKVDNIKIKLNQNIPYLANNAELDQGTTTHPGPGTCADGWKSHTISFTGISPSSMLYKMYANDDFELKIKLKITSATEYAYITDIVIDCVKHESSVPEQTPLPYAEPYSIFDHYCATGMLDDSYNGEYDELVDYTHIDNDNIMINGRIVFILEKDDPNGIIIVGTTSSITRYLYYEDNPSVFSGYVLGDTLPTDIEPNPDYYGRCAAGTIYVTDCYNNVAFYDIGSSSWIVDNTVYLKQDECEDSGPHIIEFITNIFDFNHNGNGAIYALVILTSTSFILGMLTCVFCQLIFVKQRNYEKIYVKDVADF